MNVAAKAKVQEEPIEAPELCAGESLSEQADYLGYPEELTIAKVGELVLRKPAQPVTDFSDPALAEFLQKLQVQITEAGGVGIAAPQVFCSRQIMIIASRPNKRYPDAPAMAPLVLINPSFIAQSQNLEKGWEGCLSVPGLRGQVARADWVEVFYRDPQGQQQRRRFDGFVARIFLHEYDHLIGRTWLDSVTDNKEIVSDEVYLRRFASN